MRRFILITVVQLLMTVSSLAQHVRIKQTNFYNITEIGYGHGIGNINFKEVDVKIKNESKFFRLRTEFGWFVNEKFSLGIGFGLDGYHNYTFNTAPLFLDGRYYFKPKPQSFFVFSNLGYAIPIANNFEKGIMGGVSIGKKISSRKLILLPSIGVNIQQLQDIGYYLFDPNQASSHGDNISLVSIQFNLGLMF